MSSRFARGLLVCGASLLFGACSVLPTAHSATAGWVGVWGASPEPPPADVPVLDDSTLRLIVHTELGGDQLRVRLSNRYGTTPLIIDAAYVGVRDAGAALRTGSGRALKFGGFTTITVPAGALTITDAVDLPVPAGVDLAVSFHVVKAPGSITLHALALQHSYASKAGNFAARDDAAPFTTPLDTWPFIANIELHAAAGAHTIVTFGDSITDGYLSTTDANSRWPDYLARRLHAAGKPIAVVNQGIGGNRLLYDAPAAIPYFGRNGLSRFDSDVLVTPGLTHIVVLIGINDIGQPAASGSAAEMVSADQLLAGYRQLILRAHNQGIKIIGATLTPFDTFTGAKGYFSAQGEIKRQAINAWIRTAREFDAVIDFDAAVRDPAHPSQFLPAYDSGDHLHPGDAGYKAMADAVDLSLFN